MEFGDGFILTAHAQAQAQSPKEDVTRPQSEEPSQTPKVGDRLRKDFDTIYDGMIIDIWYDKSAISYTVIYEDGDCEDLSKKDVLLWLPAIPRNEGKAEREALIRKWRSAGKGYEAAVIRSSAKPVSNATALEFPEELLRFTYAWRPVLPVSNATA